MSEELPPNWEERFDESSNQKYYVNVVTFASQWEKPTHPRPPPSTFSQPPQEKQSVSILNNPQPYGGPPQHYPQTNIQLNQATSPNQSQPARMGSPNEPNTQTNLVNVPSRVGPPHLTLQQNTPPSQPPQQQSFQLPKTPPQQQQQVRPFVNISQPQQLPQTTPQTNELKLPPNWEERFDTASQQKYYVNVLTRESQWDPPLLETPTATENTGLKAESELPPNWEERFDAASQQKFYVNIISHTTQWERPTTKKEEIKLPPNWEERFDANSGNHYYVNIVTRESQWEPPVFTPNDNPPTGLGLNFGDKQSSASLGVFPGSNANSEVSGGTFVQTASANAKPLKFVTVGDGAVGKTCLLISFTKNSFPKEYVPTVFDNHSTVVVYEGKEYNLGLWDTAGQEEYDRLRPLSYPNTDCFLMCYAVISPPSLDNCKSKWRNEVNHYCPDAKLLLIGTKIDLRNDSETLLKLEEQHSNVLSPTDGEKACKELNCSVYIECSARTQENIKKVFDEAIRVCTAPVKKKKSKCSIL